MTSICMRMSHFTSLSDTTMSIRPAILRTLRRTIAPPSPLVRLAAIPRFISSTPVRRHESEEHWSAVPTSPPSPSEIEREIKPDYNLTFACRPCQTRSPHKVSKLAYHRGLVLLECPGCKSHHVVTDHLGVRRFWHSGGGDHGMLTGVPGVFGYAADG